MCASWMLLLHMQEIVPVDFRRAFCPLGGGGGGADILAPGLHYHGQAVTFNQCSSLKVSNLNWDV